VSPLTKILLVAVIVGIAFVAIVVFGVTRDDSKSSSTDRGSFTDFLDAISPEPPPLSPRDIVSSACFSAGDRLFRMVGPCTVRIRASEERIRAMKLTLVQATFKVQVSFAGGGSTGVNTSFPLRAGERTGSASLQVMSEGGLLTLTCVQPPPVPGGLCAVQLGGR
jgi:hypothetical protein